MDRICMDALREYQRLIFGLDGARTPSMAPGVFDGAHSFSLSNDQPKPQHSYIGLIAMAILSSPERKMVLSEVYDWIMSHYPYFRTRGSGWRNSIRHNLSLNDCFIKAGRAANGKGHYWSIHPANIRDFERGDYRRRRAQRKVRRHMGLSVPEGDSSDDDTRSPPPSTVVGTPNLAQISIPGLFGLPLSFPLLMPELEKNTEDEERPESADIVGALSDRRETDGERKPFTIDFLLGIQPKSSI